LKVIEHGGYKDIAHMEYEVDSGEHLYYLMGNGWRHIRDVRI
jgi:hypothetical protein